MKVLRNNLVSLISSFLVLLVCIFYRDVLGLQGVVLISFITTLFLFAFEALVRRYALEKTVAIMKEHDPALFKETPESIERVEEEIALWSKKQSEFLEEYRSREQFRREYIGNISHELKTPIFSIQGYIHTLLDGALDDSKVVKKFLKRAAKSVDRMTELVKDLEAISKIESGLYEIQLRPVVLLNLIDDSMDTLESFITKQKAEVEVVWEVNKDVQVVCDSARMEQVLDNLIVNAIKYSPVGSSVLVVIREKNDSIYIDVRDHGFGIPEGDLGRVFERFYRVDKARTRNEGGSGLGLSIVKHIVEAHGQEIAVTSKERAGSVFSFSLAKMMR
ncbi:MAG: Alkaline phosphatase synthesis sensor protein PhoR [Flavobacteriales bacterium UBA4585]|nr:MAG: Alkaline phosphatase synthesis sensor protein PhoR [Flavobacteriales bacterium UBA4585]